MPLNGFALIPARGGSKGIKDKNLQEINGRSLVGLTVTQAIKAGFKRVIVLSDEKRIMDEAKKYGADISFNRPAKISGDKTHMFEVYRWLLLEMKKKEKTVPDFFCTMLCTTPFRKIEHVKKAKSKLESGNYDWVLSVNEFEHHPYRAMTINAKNLLTPTYDISEKLIWANRQELPSFYRFNGGIIAGLTKHVLNNKEYNIKYKTDLKIFPIIMSQEESIDIDNPLDLELARMVSRNGKQ